MIEPDFPPRVQHKSRHAQEGHLRRATAAVLCPAAQFLGATAGKQRAKSAARQPDGQSASESVSESISQPASQAVGGS